MKKLAIVVASAGLCCTLVAQARPHQTEPAAVAVPDFWSGVKNSIQTHLGKPYAWGSSGLKSYDCSGFVWRVMYDNGVFFKRTTARKLYLSLPKPASGDDRKFGTIVFFDNLKHCGIVNDGKSFYHAATTAGTRLAPFTPFWRAKLVGFRRLQK